MSRPAQDEHPPQSAIRNPQSAIFQARDARLAPVTSYLHQVYAVVAKDLLLQFRTKDALTTMVVFALLVLVTFSFALDLRQEILAAAGPGVLWVTVVFASTLGLGRTFALERDQGTLEGLIVAPLDRSALYLAKFAVNLLLMAVVVTVSVPVFSALLNVPIDPGALLPALLLGTIGLSAVGTLFSAIAAHTLAREVMLPVLLFPIIVPLLIAVVQATGLALGAPGARDMPWLSLLLAFDAVYVAAGALAFEYTLEE